MHEVWFAVERRERKGEKLQPVRCEVPVSMADPVGEEHLSSKCLSRGCVAETFTCAWIV